MRASIAVGGVALIATAAFAGGWTAMAADVTQPDATVLAPFSRGAEQAPQPLTVVLMGDSYTAGNGARAAGSQAYYGPEYCMRSANTWGEQYARTLASNGYAVTLMNRACSAATADSVLYGRQMKGTRVIEFPQPEDESAPQNDQFYVSWAASSPRCTPAPGSEEYFVPRVVRTSRGDGSAQVSVVCDRWLPPQVDALNPDVDLVLLTLGGNDAHFPDIVRACLILSDARACRDAVGTARAYVNDDYAHELASVLMEIERRTDGHAKIAFLAYPGLEVNQDLRITSVQSSGVVMYPVSTQLTQLAAEGLAAQRSAIGAVNDAFATDVVTFVDSVPSLFAGHEPDARGGIANPDRWMYEVFETTTRDEWYHLNPDGQRHIAQLVASYGVFGAVDDNGRARDVALVVGDGEDARAATEFALADPEAWAGARVSIIEQRLADDGVHVLRRVVVADTDPGTALDALRSSTRTEWLPEGDVRLPARWNATAQAIYVGDDPITLTDVAEVWTGNAAGRAVSADANVGAVSASTAAYAQPEVAVAGDGDRLVTALVRAADVPHAWAGGPYVTRAADLALTASGSVGTGALSYSWDLDGDGAYETGSDGPSLTVPVGRVTAGWVAVRVVAPDGAASIARAWVSAGSPVADGQVPCSDQGVSAADPGASARRGCGPSQDFAGGPDAHEVPSSPIPAHEEDDVLGQVSSEQTAAVLALAPLFADDRIMMVGAARSSVPTRVRDAGRRRPRELVARERGLAGLLTVDSSR